MTINKNGKTTYPNMKGLTVEYEKIDKNDKKKINGRTLYRSGSGNYLVMSNEGDEEVSKMTIAHNVDDDSIEQLHNLQKDCQKKLGCK